MSGCYNCWIDCSLIPGVCLANEEKKSECSIAEWRLEKKDPEFYFGVNPEGMSSYRCQIRLWCMFMYVHQYHKKTKGNSKIFLDPKSPGMMTNAFKLLMCMRYLKKNQESLDVDVLRVTDFEEKLFLKLLVYCLDTPIKDIVSFIQDNYGDGYGQDFINELLINKKPSGMGNDLSLYVKIREEKYKNALLRGEI